MMSEVCLWKTNDNSIVYIGRDILIKIHNNLTSEEIVKKINLKNWNTNTESNPTGELGRLFDFFLNNTFDFKDFKKEVFSKEVQIK